MRKINISQVDTLFANGNYPIEFLFYYKEGLKTKRIRSALSKLSSAFWPLFGEYKSGIIYFDNYSENECFDEEVVDQEFDATETNINIYKKYSLINPSQMKKLFYLKIIQYKNGTLMIPKLNHLAGDGYSYFYFLATLSAVYRNMFIPFKTNLIRSLYRPHHQRTVLKEFLFAESILKPFMLGDQFTIEYEEIPRQDVWKAIKDVVSRLNYRISTNDVLSAMAIKKSVKVQKEYFGDNVKLTIPIDVRRQIKEYGQKYFGNGIMLKVIDFETRYIENSSVDEIAVEIRKSMPSVSKDAYLKYLEELEAIIATKQTDKLKPFDPGQGCLVTNLSKLPVDKLNFGTGNPDLIFPLTIEKNSTAILAAKDNFVLRFAY
jgi:NifU-like protein involved in Fe-S cluster formation